MRFLVEIHEEVRIPWPTKAGPAVHAALVMVLERKPCVVGSGMLVAREEVTAKFGFVDIQLTEKPHYFLPIAVATGNAIDWATDHSRIMQPEHPVLNLMIKRFEKLERTVWQVEPEGGVWDREVIGVKLVSLSNGGGGCIAIDKGDASATYPSTTQDRSPFVEDIGDEQLQNSVEQASTELLQLIGSRDGAGPYAAVLPQVEG